MEDVIHRIFPHWVSVRIEKPEWVVAARVYGKTNLGNRIIRGRCSLCPTQRTLNVGTANVELVIVLGVGAQFGGFDLFESLAGPMMSMQ